MKANTVVWIILMLLTVVSVRLSDSSAAVALILAVAGLKFALVGWQFMDLRKSPAVWSAALFAVLGLTLGMVFLLA